MATMESLIGLVNRIQRACTALGHYGDGDAAFSSLWDALRSVAVVGDQLHKTEGRKEEYAEFGHMPCRRFTDFFVNLTLIDLPGSTKVAVEGQPESIVEDIEKMVRTYVEKPNSIILAISPGNQDIATSDAMKLAREVDPYGFRKLLSQHLESVIKAKIPGVISLINKGIDEMEAELDHLGRPIAIDAGAQLYTILDLCRAFDKIFKEHLDGGRSGGDRIYGVFDHQLPAALRKLPFDKHLSLQNVRKLVSEADGYQPHLIAPEQGYRRLIEGSLNYFRGPAKASVDAVHFVLKELVRKSIGETEELRRFPTLQSALAAAAGEALEKFRDESKKTVVRMVEMESSYLTVDFFRKLPQEGEKMGPTPSPGDHRNPPGPDRMNPSEPLTDRYVEAHFRRIGSNVSSYIGMVSDTLRITIPKAVGKQLEELLDEDPSLMSKRQEIAKRLELYKAAREEIDAVA